MKLDKIRKLLDIMDANGLAEIEIEEDGLKIRLRKGELPSETVVTFSISFGIVQVSVSMSPSMLYFKSLTAGTGFWLGGTGGPFLPHPGKRKIRMIIAGIRLFKSITFVSLFPNSF